MSKKADDALIALRQILRKTESSAKRLANTAGLTPSQLRVLQVLAERGETSAGDISQLTQLKLATLTSLVDKLEARGLVTRRRCEEDRRRVWVAITGAGGNSLHAAPDLLQDTFQHRFAGLPDWQQSMIVASLEHVASLLDAENVEAAPILDVGALDERPLGASNTHLQEPRSLKDVG